MVGDTEGLDVGEKLGTCEGELVGYCDVGVMLGVSEGAPVGLKVMSSFVAGPAIISEEKIANMAANMMVYL